MTDYEIVMAFLRKNSKICKEDIACLDCFYKGHCNIKDLANITEEQYNKIMGLVDWSKVKVDTPILVSHDCENWNRRYFAEYRDGKVYAWDFGRTSWTAPRTSDDDAKSYWKYAKLAEEHDINKENR